MYTGKFLLDVSSVASWENKFVPQQYREASATDELPTIAQVWSANVAMACALLRARRPAGHDSCAHISCVMIIATSTVRRKILIDSLFPGAV
jgi:hypothetical protein